jgi:hypothetical protein
MNHREQLIKAARMATAFVRIAGYARDSRPALRQALHLSSVITGLSDDNRLSRQDQVTAIKVGGAIIAMACNKFGQTVRDL